MGQHKFEDQIRRKLRNREIKPSGDAWKKLDARLENKQEKSRSYYWLIGIAASFTAAFLILSLFLKTRTLEEDPAVVASPAEINEKASQNFSESNSIEEKVATGGIEKVAAKEVNEPVVAEVEKSNLHSSGSKMAYEQQIAQMEEVEVEQKEVETKDSSNELQEILPKPLEQIIAEISTEAYAEGDITEAEVEALLYKAATEISMERERENFAGNVDATALLKEVEMELDESFREKIFDILKEGYLKARTAVANRNF